ncbi:MAG TPA: PstS family phosphate ABC transporter substrate-binding protein [Candidatus Deferrimicrobiaceae bacterium]|nr:PstS family phosphate ABC transporter substrate-binding protein [Candidatus Deferrimicrobiaceae bacterium]
MTQTRPRHIAALALSGLFAAAACTSPGATDGPTQAALSGTVAIDGSSTVYPITELVAEEFQVANPGVRVPVAFSGTGGGFKKFCAGETDINDASRPIKADDEGEGVACETNVIEWVELQVAIDGITVVVNPGNEFVTCLTVEELAAIYGPDAREHLLWSEVRAGFPAEEVQRFMPGADSGTFDYFTEVVNGEVDAATTWATQSEDDNQLVTGVAGDTFAIGFFGYAYYVENQDKLAAVEIDGGSGCVAPTDETINSDTYAPLSRPLFIYPSVSAAKERPELKALVDYYLATTNEFSAEVGYIALPDDLLAAEVAEWQAAVGG